MNFTDDALLALSAVAELATTDEAGQKPNHKFDAIVLLARNVLWTHALQPKSAEVIPFPGRR